MGSINNEGTKDAPRWYIRYKDVDGKRKHVPTNQPTRELARRYLAEVEARIARGLIGIPERPKAEEQLTLEELRKEFLDKYTRPRIKNATGYRAAARVELGRLPASWLKRPANSITQDQVVKLRDQLGKDSYAPNTINGTLRVLSTLYNWGRAKKLLTCPNPCQGVERHAVEHLLEYFGETCAHEVDRLLTEAFARCWGPAPSLPPVLFPLVATAVYTGMRKGELFAWRWQDLDLETRRHDVMRAVKHDGKVGTPKSGKPRHLRLPLKLIPILRRWKELCPETPEGLVFPVPTEKWDRSADRLTRLEQAAAGQGDRARDARKMLQRIASSSPSGWRMGRHDDDLHLADLIRLAGCTPSKVGRNVHKLRHTFGRNYMQNGGNIVRLQEILGHSDLKMTMIYARFAPGHLEDEMDRVDYPVAPPAEGVVHLDEHREMRA